MGCRWPCAEWRGGTESHGPAETGVCQGQRSIWTREHHAKPGFKEPRTLILGQPPRRKGSHGIPAALSPLVTPSTPAMRPHVACSGHLPVPLPPTLRAHTPTGCGHGGTRKSSISRTLQTWSVNPAAMAGVWGCQRFADPVPFVGSGSTKGIRKLACGRQKLS